MRALTLVHLRNQIEAKTLLKDFERNERQQKADRRYKDHPIIRTKGHCFLFECDESSLQFLSICRRNHAFR